MIKKDKLCKIEFYDASDINGMMRVMQFTVGICAYNEGKNIKPLLENILCEQELPVESEILVVCSGCTDNSVEIVQDYAKKDPRVNAFIENERRGKASAINHILANAKGDAVLFVSADALPHKMCFSLLTSKLQDSNVGVVCGRPVPITSTNSLVDRLVQILWRFHDHVFEQLSEEGLARHASEVYCIRKGIVDKIPPETVNDDAYLALVAKKKGWRIEYEPRSSVSICGPQTFPDYFKQRRRILTGHRQVKKLTGESPQHVAYLLPLYPKRVIKMLLWLCNEYDITIFLTFVWIESLINIIALADSVLRKPPFRWNISTSTKRVIRE